MKPVFHPLKISKIERLGALAIAVRFAVPDHLREAYDFIPGQYLTLRTMIDGVDVRRPYSICTSPSEISAGEVGAGEVGVGIKLVEEGVFSTHALNNFAVGDDVQVMTPQGRFAYSPDAGNDAESDAESDGPEDLLLLAAGSGITPILSIACTALTTRLDCRVTLIYGNRDAASIMFRAAVEDLKDRYMDRLRLVHILSREMRDIGLLNGRIDADKIAALVDAGLIEPTRLKAGYICGPDSMITDCVDALSAAGMSVDQLFFERFTPSADLDGRPRSDRTKRPEQRPQETAPSGHEVEVMLDGTAQLFNTDPAAETVLAAGHRAGLELPYSCAAGMCCTCRCKVVEGSVTMDANFSLEQWEIDAGFVLSCQARPDTKRVKLDFDAQ